MFLNMPLMSVVLIPIFWLLNYVNSR
jgi:hypothetical protein